ncbi:MAG: RNA polymerase sigma factor [Vicinamibacteraceae bacterium]
MSTREEDTNRAVRLTGWQRFSLQDITERLDRGVPRRDVLGEEARTTVLGSQRDLDEAGIEGSSAATIASIDYSDLRQRLARAVARMCPGWLSSQRDDLVQSAVVRLMQLVKKKTVGGEGDPPFAPFYLYKVAYSALVDEIRLVRRRRETDIEDHAGGVRAVATEDPERAAASREVGRAVRDCLARMTRDRRLAVTLYLQGHTVLEASRILDWPVKRTENLVYRGLADLRKCLMSKGIRP